MGFGLLFIGYISTYLLFLAGGYGCYPEFIGCLIMLYALTKLIEYEPRFKYAFFSVIGVTVCVAYNVITEFTLMLGFSSLGFLGTGIIATVFVYAKAIANLVFHAALLLSIAKIAKDTGVEKTYKASIRNLIIYAIFFVVEMVGSFLPNNTSASLYVFFAVMLLWLSWLMLDCITIFSCYMRICDENDKEMSVKPSSFKFVNNIREEFDRREKKAHQTSREYRMQKMQRRMDHINSAKNKNNKK